MRRWRLPIVGFGLLASAMSPLSAQDDPSRRWTGFYAGGDVGGAAAAEAGGASAACHVGCGRGATYGAHAGYDSSLGSGLVGGVEADIGRAGR